MKPREAAQSIGAYFNLDADEFYGHMLEDPIGGWAEETGERDWEPGSIWEVEGQILYALVRMLRPVNLLEIGNFMGCSTQHMAEALYRNGEGHMNSFDLYPLAKVKPKHEPFVTLFTRNLFKHDYNVSPPLDFVFEDSYHAPEMCAHVWQEFMAHGKRGGVCISHDSEHYSIGRIVRSGIEQVTTNYLSVLVEPGKCGLAMGRKL